jgi:hypothetical protein
MVKKNMTQRTLLAQQMLEHVSRQRESGMTIANYAAQVGITAHKFRYWINKSKPHGSLHAKEPEMKFIDLGTLGLACNDTDTPDAPGQPIRQPQMTLTFPNGMCLKIY